MEVPSPNQVVLDELIKLIKEQYDFWAVKDRSKTCDAASYVLSNLKAIRYDPSFKFATLFLKNQGVDTKMIKKCFFIGRALAGPIQHKKRDRAVQLFESILNDSS